MEDTTENQNITLLEILNQKPVWWNMCNFSLSTKLLPIKGEKNSNKFGLKSCHFVTKYHIRSRSYIFQNDFLAKRWGSFQEKTPKTRILKRGEVIFKSGAILEWIWYLIIMYVIRVLPFKVSNGYIRLLLKRKGTVEVA